MSIGLTTVFLLTRIPRQTLSSRVLRLGSYLSVGFAHYYFNKELEKKFVDQTFENVALKILQDDDLKQLHRAYQIKKQALDQDKKDLAKYKFDP